MVEWRRGAGGYPSVMRNGDESSPDPATIAGFFSDLFGSKFTPPLNFDPADFSHIQSQDEKLSDLCISYEQIVEYLQGLEVGKGAGPDLIPPIFLKSTASAFAKLLEPLFNRSLQQGVFPDIFKLAHVTPVFKSGDRGDVTNYRAISILSSVGKVFERLVCTALANVLRPSIHPSQHGFLDGKSTVSNLVEYTSFVRSLLAIGIQCDAVYTDLSSAFDTVDHGLLLFKLERYGVRGPMLEWLRSYLSGRRQKVKFMGCISQEVAVVSGVPQGSILGPLLFLIFVNDLSTLLNDVAFSLYADDLKIFRAVANGADAAIMQTNLDILFRWCGRNGMHLNVKKCFAISFSKHPALRHLANYQINGFALTRVEQIRDLGVLLDSKLDLKPHIDKICSSAYSVLGFVKRRLKELSDPHICKRLYCALVRPILEYASVVWSPARASDTARLESVPKAVLALCPQESWFSSGPK